jgi:hypothetical protein
MRKILAGCAVAFAALVLSFGPSIQSSAQAVAPAYCWGTLRIVAGIAVCDGAAYNCTHPCAPVEPKDPILVDAGAN